MKSEAHISRDVIVRLSIAIVVGALILWECLGGNTHLSAAGFRVSGTILNPLGQPTTGGNVRLLPVQGGTPRNQQGRGARIAADGAIEFLEVEPGDYVIQVYRDRGPFWREGVFGMARVRVTQSPVERVVVRQSEGSSVSGRLEIETTTDVRPALYVSTLALSPIPTDFDSAPPPNQLAVANVHADLTFEMAGLHGRRRLQLLTPVEGWALKSIRLDANDITDQPLSFGTAAESIRGVTVVLTDRVSRLNGIVTDQDGHVGPASVVAFSTDRSKWYYASRFSHHVVATSTGRFGIHSLPAGTYNLAAIGGGRFDQNRQWDDPVVLSRIQPLATVVTIRPEAPVSVYLRASRLN